MWGVSRLIQIVTIVQLHYGITRQDVRCPGPLQTSIPRYCGSTGFYKNCHAQQTRYARVLAAAPDADIQDSLPPGGSGRGPESVHITRPSAKLFTHPARLQGDPAPTLRSCAKPQRGNSRGTSQTEFSLLAHSLPPSANFRQINVHMRMGASGAQPPLEPSPLSVGNQPEAADVPVSSAAVADIVAGETTDRLCL